MTLQTETLDNITKNQHQLAEDWFFYWNEFSAFTTWEFWLHVFIFILPLLILYKKIDRSIALQLGFFGFNIHVWFFYFDAFGTRQAFWTYPYQIIPFIPNSVGLDASLVPVLFILFYQWILRKQKNYYFYTLLLSGFLSFVLKPVLVHYHLFEFHQGATYLHLFLTFVVIISLSKWITDLFVYFERNSKP
ncbi:hypothetical protein [Bacillus weihaiensis]|uniref:Uncharacterized protein n=1 Tax=Bacillus weihaiensis TaxID=1547283 RepID=A0A1L3MS03_9BACI|nr:hypothetical protein [Bacillus weihaiensis]APH05125.1 hypothetical protein A9C19_10390 [Bacillus weihaiensis]